MIGTVLDEEERGARRKEGRGGRARRKERQGGRSDEKEEAPRTKEHEHERVT